MDNVALQGMTAAAPVATPSRASVPPPAVIPADPAVRPEDGLEETAAPPVTTPAETVPMEHSEVDADEAQTDKIMW